MPQFEYDVFISYAHKNNSSGWVSDFCKDLSEKYATLKARDLKVWRDPKLEIGDKVMDAIVENGIKKSALFLCIFSPSYIVSPYCRAEFNKFLEYFEDTGIKSKIIPIVLLPFDNIDETGLEPQTLQEIEAITKNKLPTLLFSEFYEKDPENKTSRELSRESDLYDKKIRKIVDSIHSNIQDLRSRREIQIPDEREKTVSDERKTIFLSLSPQFASDRIKIVRELSRRKQLNTDFEYTSVPEKVTEESLLDLEAKNLEGVQGALGHYLEKMFLGIFFIDFTQEEYKQSLEYKQYLAALEMRKSKLQGSNLSNILLYVKGTPAPDDDSVIAQQVLDSKTTPIFIELFPENAENNIQTFLLKIIQKLESLERSLMAEKAAAHKQNDATFNNIYHIFYKDDISLFMRFDPELSRIETPKYIGMTAMHDKEEDCEEIKPENCHGAIIYNGKASNQWFIGNTSKIIRLEADRKCLKLGPTANAIYTEKDPRLISKSFESFFHVMTSQTSMEDCVRSYNGFFCQKMSKNGN